MFYPKFSRSINGGVRFGVRCGPRTPKTLAANAVRIGGAGRNRPFITAIAEAK